MNEHKKKNAKDNSEQRKESNSRYREAQQAIKSIHNVLYYNKFYK